MKGIGIMLMIIGHLTPYATNIIFSFHMPLFFIVSGYFYKQTDIKSGLINDAKRLIIPYIVTSSIVITYYLILSIATSTDWVTKWIIATLFGAGVPSSASSILPNMPMIGAIWFLLALFWCRNIYNIIFVSTSNKNKTFIICTILSLSAIFIHNKSTSLPLSINQGFSALIFYIVGIKIKDCGGFNCINKTIIALFILLWIIAFIFSSLSMVNCTYKMLPLDILGAIGGTIVIYYLSIFIKNIKYVSLFFAFVGINSLAFLCIHLVDLDAPTSWIFGINSKFKVIYDIIFCFFVVFCFSKFELTKKIYSIRNIK